MTNMFDNADTFLNANSDLFAGLNEADLLVPEKLVFTKGETVQGTILDLGQINSAKFQGLKVELKVETGDNAGKIHEFVIAKPVPRDGKIMPSQKKQWVDFLLALFTKEEILGGNPDFSKHTLAKLEMIAGEAKPNAKKPGEYYQNFSGYKIITE